MLNLRGAIADSGAMVTHDPLPAVLADETQLVQLFQNLIGNAIKYQNPGVPRIHISAVKNDGGRWTFSVRDNGLGIDPQYFERIFVMFQRCTNARNLPAPALAWRSARKSSSGMAAKFRSSRSPVKDPHSALRWQAVG